LLACYLWFAADVDPLFALVKGKKLVRDSIIKSC
jgi:hypothetical protein